MRIFHSVHDKATILKKSVYTMMNRSPKWEIILKEKFSTQLFVSQH